MNTPAFISSFLIPVKISIFSTPVETSIIFVLGLNSKIINRNNEKWFNTQK